MTAFALIGWVRGALQGPRTQKFEQQLSQHEVTECPGFRVEIYLHSQDGALRDLPGCVPLPALGTPPWPVHRFLPRRRRD